MSAPGKNKRYNYYGLAASYVLRVLEASSKVKVSFFGFLSKILLSLPGIIGSFL